MASDTDGSVVSELRMLREDMDEVTHKVDALGAYLRDRINIYGQIIMILGVAQIWGVPKVIVDLAGAAKDPAVIQSIGAIATAVVSVILLRRGGRPPS